MASKSDWPVIPVQLANDEAGPAFFTQHEWDTIEAATARIYPTDHQAGAREAGVVRFIDRYMSGLTYIFASADGSGFLELSGKLADAWRGRINDMQEKYRTGILDLDRRAQAQFGKPFKALDEQQQDTIIEAISGTGKPMHIRLSDTRKLGTMLQGVSDDSVPFFEMLALHTRQGMFCDPAYGGNRNRVGWEMIGFPGPKSLKDTNDCTYSVREYFVQDYDWKDLIPHLRDASE
jgi:gluconate 2-dehydrogenase gamma chain